jgi:adenosylhomocysteinase
MHIAQGRFRRWIIMDELLKKGSLRLRWAYDHMPVMRDIDERFSKDRPLAGIKIGMALHTEAKTGVLAIVLANAGAKIRLASCNPLSTDDSVALALREEHGLDVYAKKGETQDEYYRNLNSVLNLAPDFLIDDGADLVTMAHTSRRDVLANIKGANEETTTGVVRLKAMAKDGKLEFPVLSVNDARMKFLFDNRYGTGQSTFDGWMNATNLIVAGKRLVVAGYGWCGKGIAMRAKGMGASVIVTEIDPVKAIEAKMDGFEVMRMIDAVKVADIVLTVTGCKDIVRREHLDVMKDGCVLGNAGHFDNEISKTDLLATATSVSKVREYIEEYLMKDGRRIDLIADGRLMNLAAGQGHPAEIMDTSFAAQALGIEYLTKNYDRMDDHVYNLPDRIDEEIANIKLRSMGVQIDALTDDQKKYISGWEEGT